MTRISAYIDDNIRKGAVIKLKDAGIDEGTALKAFFINVAKNGKLPFDNKLDKRERQIIKFAAKSAQESNRGIKEITNQQELDDWFNEDGDDE